MIPITAALNRRLSFRARILVAFIVCLTGGGLRCLAQSQDDVTVAFLYNFARFVERPATSFLNDEAPFTVGFIGRPALADKFAQAMQGRNIGGREFNIQKLGDASNAAACQMIFVGDAGEVPAVLTKVKGKPVLCVGEGEDFLAAGGMIAVIRDGPRLVFDINPGALSSSALTASDKITKAARSVRGLPQQK